MSSLAWSPIFGLPAPTAAVSIRAAETSMFGLSQSSARSGWKAMSRMFGSSGDSHQALSAALHNSLIFARSFDTAARPAKVTNFILEGLAKAAVTVGYSLIAVVLLGVAPVRK